jgi:hypothetical protein
VTQIWRNPGGGLIDRSQSMYFTFNGVRYGGYAGDTLDTRRNLGRYGIANSPVKFCHLFHLTF